MIKRNEDKIFKKLAPSPCDKFQYFHITNQAYQKPLGLLSNIDGFGKIRGVGGKGTSSNNLGYKASFILH